MEDTVIGEEREETGELRVEEKEEMSADIGERMGEQEELSLRDIGEPGSIEE